MSTWTRIGRLGGLAIGMGIGAALGAIPGLASADGNQTLIDGNDVAAALSAAPVPATPLDIQINIGGIDLFPTVGNTATAVAGFGDMAIAIGSGSIADAQGGFGDFAYVSGTNSLAVAGDTAHASGSNFDYASVTGNNDDGEAGKAGSFDSASIIGNHDIAAIGFGEFATPATVTNFDAGVVLGDHSNVGANYGSNDLALVFDPFGTIGSNANAGGTLTMPGNFDAAEVFSDGTTQNSVGDLTFHIAGLF